MKIDKKLIKELVDNLKEFGLTELGIRRQTKLKFQKLLKELNSLKQALLSLKIKLY